MSLSYNKGEKLKQKKIIDRLFSSGESVNQYPLRLVYITNAPLNDGSIKMAVSVNKDTLKAVDIKLKGLLEKLLGYISLILKLLLKHNAIMVFLE